MDIAGRRRDGDIAPSSLAGEGGTGAVGVQPGVEGAEGDVDGGEVTDVRSVGLAHRRGVHRDGARGRLDVDRTAAAEDGEIAAGLLDDVAGGEECDVAGARLHLGVRAERDVAGHANGVQEDVARAVRADANVVRIAVVDGDRAGPGR